MLARRLLLTAGFAAGAAALIATPAATQDRHVKIKAVATFSILGDLVRNIGGDRVEITTLVGPNGDAHVYSPTPGDARKLAAANVVFVNGLGLEGWMTRLITASGTKAPMFVVTKGVTPRQMQDEDNRGRTAIDPHAWQSVADAKMYVANIRDGLATIDPDGKSTYDANAAAYLAKLDELEKEVKAAIDGIPADRRKIFTTHDAFGYFGAVYGIAFIAPEGVSTEAEPSAKDVARDHHSDQEAEDSRGVSGEHQRSTPDGSDCPRNRRDHRRHALFRRVVRTGRPGGDLYRHDAP